MGRLEELVYLLVDQEAVRQPGEGIVEGLVTSSAVRSSTSSEAERREATSRFNKMTSKMVTTRHRRTPARAWTAGDGPLARGFTATLMTHPGLAGNVTSVWVTPGWGLPARAATSC